MGEYWESLTTGKKLKLILTVILCIFVIIFAIVNWEIFAVNFVFFSLDLPVTLLIIICLCIGYLISTLFEYRHYNERMKEITALKAEIERLSKLVVIPVESTEENNEEVI